MDISFKQSNAANFGMGRSKAIKYITIHYTANNGDTAKGNIEYFRNNVTGTSAHYFVDEYETVWQSVKDDDTAWHCGTTGTYRHADCRNNNSIGIEMCSRKDVYGQYFIKDETVKNTVALVKLLMAKYDIPPENILRHNDVTGKVCPEPFVRDGLQWSTFKSVLAIKRETASTPRSEGFRVTDENLTAMTEAGVMRSPDYWRNQSIKHLDELLSNARGKVDRRIDNGVSGSDIAFDILISAGIIASPAYWKNLIKSNTTQYLEDLIINLANRSRIVLEKLIHAEAQGEGLDGQMLVGNVVFNRNRSGTFPDGLYNVVFQSEYKDKKTTYQFSPIGNSAYQNAQPSSSVKRAVDKVLDGEDSSHGATYFCSVASAKLPGNWHERALTFLFEHGGHRFYK